MYGALIKLQSIVGTEEEKGFLHGTSISLKLVLINVVQLLLEASNVFKPINSCNRPLVSIFISNLDEQIAPVYVLAVFFDVILDPKRWKSAITLI